MIQIEADLERDTFVSRRHIRTVSRFLGLPASHYSSGTQVPSTPTSMLTSSITPPNPPSAATGFNNSIASRTSAYNSFHFPARSATGEELPEAAQLDCPSP